MNFTNYSTSGNLVHYRWDFGDGSHDTAFHTKHLFPKANGLDSYRVKLVVSNKQNGLQDSIAKWVVVGSLPFSAGNDTLICGNTLNFLPKAPHPKASVGWKLAAHHQILNYSHINYHLYRDTNTVYFEANFGNCRFKDQKQVVNLSKLPQFNKPYYTCAGDSSLVFLPDEPQDWSWKWNGIAAPDSIWLKPNRQTRNSVKVIIPGCDFSFSLYTRTATLPRLDLQDSVLCGNFTRTFRSDNRNWHFDYYQHGDTLTNQLVHQPGGKYAVYWKDDSNLCDAFWDTLTLKTEPDPSQLQDTFLCGQAINLSTGNDSILVWWSTGDTAKTIKVENPGFYIANIRSKACLFYDTSVVVYGNKPQLINDSSWCFEDEPLELFSHQNQLVHWGNLAEQEPQVFTEPGDYPYETYTENCLLRDTLQLVNQCSSSIFLPNAFTPNDDELNPDFMAKGVRIEDYSMQIFSRNGRLVYTTDDLHQGWDGSILGNPAQVGVYLVPARKPITDIKSMS